MKKILLPLIFPIFSLLIFSTPINLLHAQTVGDECDKSFKDSEAIQKGQYTFDQWKAQFCFSDSTTGGKSIYNPTKAAEINKAAAANQKDNCETFYNDQVTNVFKQNFLLKLLFKYEDFSSLICSPGVDGIPRVKNAYKNSGTDILKTMDVAQVIIAASIKYNKLDTPNPQFDNKPDTVCKDTYNNAAALKSGTLKVPYVVWQNINCTLNTNGELTTNGDYAYTQGLKEDVIKQNSNAVNAQTNNELSTKKPVCEGLGMLALPCLVALFGDLVFTPVSWILILCAKLFDTVIALTLSSTIYNNVAGFVAGIWTLLRDISNIIFLLVLLYIGVMTILGREKNYKAQVVGVILSALLINFSLFYAKFIVDAGNLGARIFYKNLDTNISNSSTASGQLEVKGISEAVASKIKPQKIVTTYIENKNASAVGSAIDIFIAYVLFIGVSVIMIKIFASLFLIFLVRTISLWLLMATSAIPILFKFIDTPDLKNKIKGGSEFIDFDMWHNQIWGAAMMPAVYCMFMYFILTLLNADLFDYSVGTNSIYALLPVFIMLGITYILLDQAQKYSQKLAGNIASTITSKIEGGVKMVGGLALGAAGGAALSGLGMLGRSTLGAGGEALSSGARSLLSSGNPLARGLGRGLDKFGSTMANKSYDIRDVKFGKKTIGERVKEASGEHIDLEKNLPFTTGQDYTNMGRGKDGKGGGIKAQRDERKAARQKKDDAELAYLGVTESEGFKKNEKKIEAEKKALEEKAKALAGGEDNRKKYDEAAKGKKDGEKEKGDLEKEIKEMEKELESLPPNSKEANDLKAKIKNRKDKLDSAETKIKIAEKSMSDVEAKSDTLSDKVKGKSESEMESIAIKEAEEKAGKVQELINKAAEEAKKQEDKAKEYEEESKKLEEEMKKLDPKDKEGKKKFQDKINTVKANQKKAANKQKEFKDKKKKWEEHQIKYYEKDADGKFTKVKTDAIMEMLNKKKENAASEKITLDGFEKLSKYLKTKIESERNLANPDKKIIADLEEELEKNNINITNQKSIISEIEREGLSVLIQKQKAQEVTLLAAQVSGDTVAAGNTEEEIKKITKAIGDYNKDFSNFEERNKKISTQIKGKETELKIAQKATTEETKKRFEHYANYVEKYEFFVDNGLALASAVAVGGAAAALSAGISGGAGAVMGGAAVTSSRIINAGTSGGLISGAIEGATRGAARLNDHDETSRANRAKAIRNKAK